MYLPYAGGLWRRWSYLLPIADDDADGLSFKKKATSEMPEVNIIPMITIIKVKCLHIIP
jgi:hypothetical protein